MVRPITLPKLGQSEEEGKIVKWRKREGDTIAKGDILFEIETDKAVLEVESYYEGTLLKIVVPEGETVPIGTPLIVGPATITTLILLTSQFPIWIVLVSFALNMLVTWVVFLTSDHLSRFLSEGGIRAISRVLSLLLAAIGVNMVIRGLYLLNILGAKLTP